MRFFFLKPNLTAIFVFPLLLFFMLMKPRKKIIITLAYFLIFYVITTDQKESFITKLIASFFFPVTVLAYALGEFSGVIHILIKRSND